MKPRGASTSPSVENRLRNIWVCMGVTFRDSRSCTHTRGGNHVSALQATHCGRKPLRDYFNMLHVNQSRRQISQSRRKLLLRFPPCHQPTHRRLVAIGQWESGGCGRCHRVTPPYLGQDSQVFNWVRTCEEKRASNLSLYF